MAIYFFIFLLSQTMKYYNICLFFNTMCYHLVFLLYLFNFQFLMWHLPHLVEDVSPCFSLLVIFLFAKLQIQRNVINYFLYFKNGICVFKIDDFQDLGILWEAELHWRLSVSVENRGDFEFPSRSVKINSIDRN